MISEKILNFLMGGAAMIKMWRFKINLFFFTIWSCVDSCKKYIISQKHERRMLKLLRKGELGDIPSKPGVYIKK